MQMRQRWIPVLLGTLMAWSLLNKAQASTVPLACQQALTLAGNLQLNLGIRPELLSSKVADLARERQRLSQLALASYNRTIEMQAQPLLETLESIKNQLQRLNAALLGKPQPSPQVAHNKVARKTGTEERILALKEKEIAKDASNYRNEAFDMRRGMNAKKRPSSDELFTVAGQIQQVRQHVTELERQLGLLSASDNFNYLDARSSIDSAKFDLAEYEYFVVTSLESELRDRQSQCDTERAKDVLGNEYE